MTEERKCIHCQATLSPHHKLYCSRACRRKVAAARKKEAATRKAAARREQQRIAADPGRLATHWPRCGSVEAAAVAVKIPVTRARAAAYRLWVQGEA